MSKQSRKLSDDFLRVAGLRLGNAFNSLDRSYVLKVLKANTGCALEESQYRSWYPLAIPRFLGIPLKRDFRDVAHLKTISALPELAQRLMRAYSLRLNAYAVPLDLDAMKGTLSRIIGNGSNEQYAKNAAETMKMALVEYSGNAIKDFKEKNNNYNPGDPVPFNIDLGNGTLLVITSREQKEGNPSLYVHRERKPKLFQRLRDALDL